MGWLDNDTDGEIFREKITGPMISMIGSDNAMKWIRNETSQDNENFNYVDKILDFCEDNDIRCRWHAAMWGDHDPSWMDPMKEDLRKRITLSGVASPDMNGTFKFYKHLHFGDAYGAVINDITYYIVRSRNTEELSQVRWLIVQVGPKKKLFYSDEQRTDPLDVTNWLPYPGNGAKGTPVLEEYPVDEANKVALREEISQRIDAVVTNRGHRFYQLDGINESFNVAEYIQIFGIDGLAEIYDEMKEKADQIAAANGTLPIEVYTNDYAILRSAFTYAVVSWVNPLGGRDWYRNWYRQHVESFMFAGQEGTVTGIGIQGHIRGNLPDEFQSGNRRITLSTYRKPLQTLAVFEKPIAITEFSLDHFENLPKDPWTYDDFYQTTRDAMRIIFGSDFTTTIHYWGFYDAWGGSFYGLYEEDWNLSPIGQAWSDLTTMDWSTDVVVTLGSAGHAEVPNAFFGEYEVSGEGGFLYSATASLLEGETAVTVSPI